MLNENNVYVCLITALLFSKWWTTKMKSDHLTYKKKNWEERHILKVTTVQTQIHTLKHTHSIPPKKEIKWHDCQKHQPQRVALINFKNVCVNFNNAKLSLYPAQPIILSCSSLVSAASFGHGLFARSSSNYPYIGHRWGYAMSRLCPLSFPSISRHLAQTGHRVNTMCHKQLVPNLQNASWELAGICFLFTCLWKRPTVGKESTWEERARTGYLDPVHFWKCSWCCSSWT